MTSASSVSIEEGEDMILKVRDEQDFNISMNLNINYEIGRAHV